MGFLYLIVGEGLLFKFCYFDWVGVGISGDCGVMFGLFGEFFLLVVVSRDVVLLIYVFYYNYCVEYLGVIVVGEG